MSLFYDLLDLLGLGGIDGLDIVFAGMAIVGTLLFVSTLVWFSSAVLLMVRSMRLGLMLTSAWILPKVRFRCSRYKVF